MKNNTILCMGLLMLGLLCIIGIAAAQQDTSGTDTSGTVLVNDIQPYNGPIGPDNPMYGLKIALENMDESFTTNETERVDKQIEHAQLRIAELREDIDLNRTDAAQHALDLYWQKMNQTNATIAPFPLNSTGLLHAQEEIAKHRFVLEHLLFMHPGNKGLMLAYNKSLDLEEKFANKTAFRFNRTIDNNNRTFLRPEFIGGKGQENHGWKDMNITVNETHPWPNWTPPSGQHGWQGMNETTNGTFPQPGLTQPPEHQYGGEKNGNNQTQTTPPPGNGWQQDQGHQQQGGNDQGGNNNDREKGNSHNK